MTDAEYIRERIAIEEKHGPRHDGIPPHTVEPDPADQWAELLAPPTQGHAKIVHLQRGGQLVSLCGKARGHTAVFTADLGAVTCMRCRQCC